jgi:uncharacterized protein YoxC
LQKYALKITLVLVTVSSNEGPAKNIITKKEVTPMVWEIAFVIFLLSLTVLTYLLIPVVLRFRDTLGRVNKTLDAVNEDLPEILKNVKDISQRVDGIVDTAEKTVQDVSQLEYTISKEIKEPLQNIAQVVGTLIQIMNKVFYRPQTKKGK